MEEVVLRYLNGEEEARDILLEDIMDLHNYDITALESEILLHKKYGKTKVI